MSAAIAWNSWSVKRVRSVVTASIHEIEEAQPTYRGRPFPDLPEGRIGLDREEDDIGAADEVLVRNIAYAAARGILGKSAVERVVTIVAHHEIVVRRHDIFIGIVRRAIGV